MYQKKTSHVLSNLKRYKKLIVIAVLGFGVTAVVAMAAIGFVVYQAGNFVVDKVSDLQQGQVEKLAEIAPQAKGFTEEFVLSFASHWLKENIDHSEIAQLKYGLTCFDALGGPDPAVVVDFVRSKVQDQKLIAGLDNLTKSLAVTTDSKMSGPDACVNMILNS